VNRFIFAAALICALPAYADARFFAAIEDLPLAPGLEERAAGFSFDSAGGRVVGALAEGPAATAAVRAFYLETLPALGWSFSPGGEDLVFLRGRERLTLSIAPHSGGARLQARLFTRPAAMDAD
jgi:hypothetical protein